MALIDEVKGEIMQKKPAPKEEAAPKPVKVKKEKTQEEIEAYRQKKIAEEEAKYLGKAAPAKTVRAPRAKKAKAEAKPAPKAESAPRPRVKAPKVLRPSEPLYFLKIPGLPKGDVLVLSLVHGAE